VLTGIGPALSTPIFSGSSIIDVKLLILFSVFNPFISLEETLKLVIASSGLLVKFLQIFFYMTYLFLS